MNSFGLISIGLLLGIVLAVLIVAVCILVYLIWQQRTDIRAARSAMTDAVAANSAATDKLRTEITFLLQQVDAERMYQASMGMQRSVRQLLTVVNALHKLVYAADMDRGGLGGSPPEFNPSMEAEETAAAGVVGEDTADQIAAEQWFARSSRSWPPNTGMGMHTVAAAPASPAVEPVPPTQPLPDLDAAYASDTAEDLPQ